MNPAIFESFSYQGENFIYLALFMVLFLGGFGLPIPEEVTLITAGYLVFKGYTDLLSTIIICLVGVITGDLAIYGIGKVCGPSFIKIKIFSKLFSKERMAKVRHYFESYGNKTVFLVRFFSGLRVAVFLMAGTLKMRIYRFMLMDFLGAALNVTITVYLAQRFGARIEDVARIFKELNRIIMAAIVIGIALSVYAYKRRRKLEKAKTPLNKSRTPTKV